MHLHVVMISVIPIVSACKWAKHIFIKVPRDLSTIKSGESRISHGGREPHTGAWTPEVVTFKKFCMSKWKNLDP